MEEELRAGGKYRMRGMPDFTTNGWMGIERTSGKHWKELPDDYMVPAGGDSPRLLHYRCPRQETAVDRFGGSPMASHGFSIDAWR